MPRTCFRFLFNYSKISQWRDHYLNYDECKKIIKLISNINDSIIKKEKKLINTKLEKDRELLKMQIEEENNIKTLQLNLFKEHNLKKVEDIQNFLMENLHSLMSDFQIIQDMSKDSDKIEQQEIDKRLCNVQLLTIANKVRKKELTNFIHNSIRNLFEIATWLRNFAVMNGLAYDKIISKFSEVTMIDKKECPSLLEEMERYLTNYVNLIQNCRDEIIKLYAHLFSDGNSHKAIRDIKIATPINLIKHLSIKVFLISFVLILISYLLITYLPERSLQGIDHVSLIDIFFPAFNFSFTIFLLLVGLAICTVVFRYYRINYVYLFELDPSVNLKTVKIFKNFFSLFLIWGILILLYRISLSYFYDAFTGHFYVPSLIIFIITIVYIFWPFKYLLSGIRQYFMRLLLRLMFPFGARNTIKFKDVIFGGIVTTMIRTYTSFALSMCLFICDSCKRDNIRGNCDKITVVPTFVISTVAYILRSSEFFNLAYHKKIYWPHLGNGFRFATSAIFATITFLYSASKYYFNCLEYITVMYPYIISGIASCLYNLYWDFFISWKVLQPKAKYFMLRDRITYPQWFYYWAIVTNFIIRWNWIFKLIPNILSNDSQFFILSISEIYRRCQWILIRTENEALNNPEKYRKFTPVPELEDKLDN